MNLKEAERTVISKPVASRPTISNFRPYSELLTDATNGSSTSEPTVTAIRPKTMRFKPFVSSPSVEIMSSQVPSFKAELSGTQACNLSDKILKSNQISPLIYKPLAKTVSRTTISLLANMGTLDPNHEQVVASESDTPKNTALKSRNDKKPQIYTNNTDRPSYDGYNWRKYGQKQVKGSEYPRSYFRCTHPNCLVKKKVERSINGEIAEIVYKGEHNHSKPRVPRRHAFDGTKQDSNSQLPNNQINDDNEVVGSSSRLNNSVKLQESYNHVPNEAFDYFCGVERVHDENKVLMDNVPTSKRRKSLSELNETLQEPQVVVHEGTDSEAVSDGFRWRKYGQKVVKGNPYPRSYYRCTGDRCNVRKHVERASDDPRVFLTTYEGKHNHEMPLKKPNYLLN